MPNMANSVWACLPALCCRDVYSPSELLGGSNQTFMVGSMECTRLDFELVRQQTPLKANRAALVTLCRGASNYAGVPAATASSRHTYVHQQEAEGTTVSFEPWVGSDLPVSGAKQQRGSQLAVKTVVVARSC